MRKPSPRFWRLLGFALAVSIAAIPLTPLLLGARFSAGLTTPQCPALYNTPADLSVPYEEITLTAPDGMQVPAWHIPARNGVAIVATPGLNGNRSHALSEFGFLAQEGYGMVVFEQRSCYPNGGRQSLGYNQAQDVLGAVAYLKERDEVEQIGAIGYSAGGVATLLAVASEPDVAAVVELGGYPDLAKNVLDPQAQYGWLESLYRRGILWSLPLFGGVNPREASPVTVIGDVSPRPVLLIYGEYEAEPGRALYAAAGQPSELWIVPGADHGMYRFVAPEEYERRIGEFFAQLLPDTGTEN